MANRCRVRRARKTNREKYRWNTQENSIIFNSSRLWQSVDKVGIEKLKKNFQLKILRHKYFQNLHLASLAFFHSFLLYFLLVYECFLYKNSSEQDYSFTFYIFLSFDSISIKCLSIDFSTTQKKMKKQAHELSFKCNFTCNDNQTRFRSRSHVRDKISLRNYKNNAKTFRIEKY